MRQLSAIWRALDTRRRIVVAVATLSTFAAVLLLAGYSQRPSMALLYAGLDGSSAGEVLAALDQRGVAYDIRGEAIYVDTASRDALRMSLAGEGLPPSGGAGYELLDTLTGFGTTSQMFDAAYLRAKEGELARTIAANPSIRAARVHISSLDARGIRPGSPPKASVAITTGGEALSLQQAKAIKYLVASAVAGMSPEDVAVIDTARGLVAAGEEPGRAEGGGDRAAELKRNVERLLEARVGHGKALVEVSVETVTESESITERKFDPDGRVVISTDTEERSTTSKDQKPGAVTVASNLPSGSAAPGSGSSEGQTSETRERKNFEVSETTREVVRNPGAVRRLTVAVLVDGVQTAGADGQPEFVARPAEEIAALRDLVASAVGFDEARGDVITIQSMPLQPVAEAGTLAEDGGLAALGMDPMRLVQLAVLAIVALVLGLFVLRPILTRAPDAGPSLLPPSRNPEVPQSALTGEIDDGTFAAPAMAVVSDFDFGGSAGLPAPAGYAGDPAAAPDPVARLRRLIDERRTETVEVLRGWIEDAREEKV